MNSTINSVIYTLTVAVTVTVVSMIAYITLGSIEILFEDEDLQEKTNDKE